MTMVYWLMTRDIEGSNLTATIVTQPNLWNDHVQRPMARSPRYTLARLERRTRLPIAHRMECQQCRNNGDHYRWCTAATATPERGQSVRRERRRFHQCYRRAVDYQSLQHRWSRPVSGLTSPPPYLDVSGDNQISARDALGHQSTELGRQRWSRRRR